MNYKIDTLTYIYVLTVTSHSFMNHDEKRNYNLNLLAIWSLMMHNTKMLIRIGHLQDTAKTQIQIF